MTNKETSKYSAFTIVELLVVIVVIGVLAAVTVVAYTGISKKAIEATLQSDLNGASKQLEMFKVDNGHYPTGNNCPPNTEQVCLKSTSNNELTYNPADGSNPQTYSLDVKDSVKTITWRITNGTAPIVVTSTPTPATQGPLSPGTVVDDASVGYVPWDSPNNAMISDDVYALVQESSSDSTSTHYLKATNFGFSIPIGSTINGILVEVEKYDTYGAISDNSVKIVKSNGSVGTLEKADYVSGWPYSDTYKSYGSSTDLWGENWTASDINDVDFGMVISANVPFGGNIFLSLHENSQISTPYGYKKIKDLKVGDEVLSYNENSKTIEPKKVENVTNAPISVDNNRYFYIYSNGQLIKSSENHKFYINGTYVRADQLKVGNKLTGVDLKQYPIDKIEIIQNKTDLVWDITVKDNHNFFVNNLLTHNQTNSSPIPFIDHIRITVYYTTP